MLKSFFCGIFYTHTRTHIRTYTHNQICPFKNLFLHVLCRIKTTIYLKGGEGGRTELGVTEVFLIPPWRKPDPCFHQPSAFTTQPPWWVSSLCTRNRPIAQLFLISASEISITMAYYSAITFLLAYRRLKCIKLLKCIE